MGDAAPGGAAVGVAAGHYVGVDPLQDVLLAGGRGPLKDSPAGSAHFTTQVSVRGALQRQLSCSTNAVNVPLFTIRGINLKKY